VLLFSSTRLTPIPAPQVSVCLTISLIKMAREQLIVSAVSEASTDSIQTRAIN
jgi:hypothetical protein